MPGEYRYRADLYRGTAEYYDRFRPPYPAALIDDLRARVPLGPSSRVLDLGCGTGQVAFALARHVAEVVAVDQEAEAVAFGRGKAERRGVRNIRWVAAAAEEVALAGTFHLVTIANAFHRFDREVVTARVLPHLAVGGCIALVWGDTPWRGGRRWQRALQGVLERWQDVLDARDRVPLGWEQALRLDPHEQVLRRAGLAYEGRSEVTVAREWTVESLLGIVYSTSFLNLAVVGDARAAFEADVRARLLAASPGGMFAEDTSCALELARRGRC